MSAKLWEEDDVEIKPYTKVSLDIQLQEDAEGVKDVITVGSVVEEILEDDCLLIHVPMYRGYYYTLPHDQLLVMKFLCGSDIYALAVKYESRIEKGELAFDRVRRLSDIKPHQQRDCYRLTLSEPVEIEHMWRSENTQNQKPAISKGKMINLSDGGMLLLTDKNIGKGEKLTLTFDINGAEAVQGTALRTERDKDGSPCFKVAVRFNITDQRQKERLYKCIVDKQLEERRRRLTYTRPG